MYIGTGTVKVEPALHLKADLHFIIPGTLPKQNLSHASYKGNRLIMSYKKKNQTKF